MSVTEEPLAGSDSFWEVGQYKRTVDRQENGGKLCDELVKIIRERAAIEKEYAKQLKTFTKTWNDRIDKGSKNILHDAWSEYGTTAGAWKGILMEAEQMAEVHLRIREKLIEEVEANIAKWKKENYKKSAIGPCKETKALDDEFKKAQKPWEKRLSKVKKSRKEYHTACKNEKSALHQENNAKSDSGVSQDQMKKLQDKVDKCGRDVENSKEKYENALSDLNAYNAKYMEDMTEVFNKSQDFERRRLSFFKEMLFGIHKCLDISQSAEIPAIYRQYEETIKLADGDRDLKWWSMSHGVDMPMNWPQFEEYSPDFHTISRKEKKGAGGEGITITAIKKNETAPPTYNNYNDRNNGVMSTSVQPPVQPTPQPPSAVSEDKNPFGEEEEDGEWGAEYDNPLADDGAQGVPVRALYDYDGAEEDELTFKSGDVFVKLADRDDQGWCKGRLNGRVGLYPDNYVEMIES